jgi:hypothetical protein
MNRFWLPAIALFALSAKAQNINFPDIPHIHTALNHLTVIDLGEPIQLVATADHDSFQIERAGDKVLLQPLKDGASTNLIVWTASRQVSYELDAPGNVAKMNVLVKNLPQPAPSLSTARADIEREQIAAAAIKEAMLGAKEVTPEQPAKVSSASVRVSILRVLRTGDGTYLQYEIVNHSVAPFRVTTPSVAHLQPTQTPVSLLALRDRQLSVQTLSAFKAKPDGSMGAISGESQQADVAPGGTTTGYVVVHTFTGSAPEIYQLDFGSTPSGSLVETVVI